MGLDAVVYRSRSNLPFDPEQVGATLDPSTGEYCFAAGKEDDLERRFPRETRVAAEVRIGNLAVVSTLREKAARVLTENSVIRSKVLYSGTHTGDAIPVAQLSGLENELTALRHLAQERDLVDLREFVQNMDRLVTVARQENNPIVF